MKSKSSKSPVPAIIQLVCAALDDKKAADIRVLNVSEQSSITDFLVLATGNSDPHLRALRVELEKVLDSNAMHIVGMDSSQESGWLVIDAFDLMIHVMTAENREKYALEKLWKDAEEVSTTGALVVAKAKPKKAPAKPKKTKTSKTSSSKTAKPKKKKPE